MTFDGVAATGVTFVDGRMLTAITPATAVAKKVDVVVTNPDGQRGVGTASFIYAVFRSRRAQTPSLLEASWA